LKRNCDERDSIEDRREFGYSCHDDDTERAILKEDDLYTEYIYDKVENFYLGYVGEDLLGIDDEYILT